MTVCAEGARHIRTLWQSPSIPWHWWALKSGILQPNRKQRFKRWAPRGWWLKVGPFYLERDLSKWEIGLCAGRRMVYVMRHR